jgi:polar amino acid transport system substrate-binding protein
MSTVRPIVRAFATVSLAGALVAGLAACASSGGSAASGGASTVSVASSTAANTTTVQLAANSGPGGTPTSVQVAEQASIRSELPASVTAKGTLEIGVGALPSGFPPLVYLANDNKSIIGSEPDLGRLIAAVLGLKPDIENSTWDNLFVGIDSGKVDAGFSNITDTEQRKEKYDFASYRQDNLGFAVKGSNTWTFDRTDPNAYEKLAGLTVATDAGTNQEKILLAWQAKLKTEGKNFTVKYFPDATTTFAAIVSGQVDAYFSANPGIAYQASATKGTDKAIADAGTYSGAGASLQGLIAATTKKGDGLAQPFADAINYLIKNGQYATLLKAYGLSNEAVDTSQVNPPGLPISNS